MPSRRGIVDNLTVEEYLADDAYYDNNQIVKNYANRTREGFRQVERKWNRWCNQFGFDPQATLLEGTKFRLFIRWMVKNSRMKKQSSVMQQWKRLRLIYAEASGQKLQEKTGYEIFRYITQPLTKEHDFDLSVAPKPTMTIEDLAIIIHYHWVHDPSIFPTERQRVQFAFIMLLIAYTGSRPGALMNTESGEESKPKGLRYQDFELVLLRDPENPAVHVLIMHAVLHHMKGREGNGKPTSYMFWQRDDSLAFCPITMFLSLAFADGAIDAKTGIHSPADLFSKKVPRGLNAIRIPWEPGVEKKPVLLASQVSGCFQACSDRMLRFNSFSSDVRRLGLHAGFPDAVTSYCTRRAVANAVDAVATDAQRNQVLGHASSGLSTYQKHYQSERVAIDVQAVYCGHPSRTLLRQTAGHMSLYRDPRAPVQLSPEEKQSVREDPTIQSLTEHCKTLEIKRNWKRHTGAKAKAHGGPDCKELATARALLKSEIGHKERELFKLVRTKYFRSIGTIELNRQSCKGESDMDSDHEPTLKILQYTFEERKRLIHSLFKAVDPEKEPRSVILEARLRAISDLTALCSKREIKRREANMTVNNTSVSIETGNCASASDGSDPTCTLQPLPLICGRICLVCCGDLHLSQDDRIKVYNRKDILQKHFERHHSSSIQARKSSWCGHPACSKTVIQGVMLFKNHAARVHSIFM